MSIDLTWVSQQFPSLTSIHLLAAGGQKWVFTAEHKNRGICVLKLFKPDAADRVDRELEAVLRVRAPNIPAIFETATITSPIGPLVWLTEQFVDGITLSDLIIKHALNKDEILKLADELLVAAVAAERVRVVHRDIKPANIIIDTNGKAWLLDFGIARLLDMASKTRTSAPLGPHSPGYGAPEQFRNRKREIDGRADLFAIGVVLYESLTGSNPFLQGARDRFEILHRVESTELPPLQLPWDIDGGFSEFISTLTQKQLYRRPRTCLEAYNWLCALIQQKEGSK
jgi:serine/threonine-protein kinase